MSDQIRGFSHYLPVSNEAKRWEIYCSDAGYSQIPAATPYPPQPEKHPDDFAATVTTGRVLHEFQVIYISSGRGWFENSKKERFNVQAGDLLTLCPGVSHAYSPDWESGWHEYWVGFSGDHAQRLYQNGLISSDESIHHIGQQQQILADFEQIIQLCRQQPPGFQILLGALVLQLLAHIHFSRMQPEINSSERALVNSTRSLMLLHLEDGITVEEIASKIGLSYYHLLHIFRRYTGLTPYQYFLQLRILRAKELLLDPTLTIKEISARLNFENQYYFSRLFSKKTGSPPSIWRRSAQNIP